ncbi:MAG TPA: NUDIX hydrolase [Myxococcaceae bacterium]|nr:NUDIX hydrolase [Myxococcaceae bacterium]
MSGPRPWKKTKEGTPRDYRIFRVREDEVKDPRNGSLHVRVYIDSVDWVNVIPVTDASQVVLIRQFRFGTWSNTLEIPGGMLEPGEDAAAAAARELEEETGYRAREMKPLGWVHPNPAVQGNRCHSFLALGCEKVHGGHPDAGEDIQVELRDRADVPELIRAGQITHSLVVCAFHLDALTRR